MDTVNLDHAEALATLRHMQVTAGLGVYLLVVLAPMGFGIGLGCPGGTRSIFGHPSLGGAPVGSHRPQVASASRSDLVLRAHMSLFSVGECRWTLHQSFARRSGTT